MFIQILASLVLMIPAELFADSTHPQGVWIGTIGKKPVVACFNKNSGSYYYLDHLEPINLDAAEMKNQLIRKEWLDTGQWKLTAPAKGFIAGTWSEPKTKKNLPIKLKLIDGREDETACSRESYNSRLEAVPEVKKDKMIEFSKGRSYRKIWFLDQTTIELFGPDRGIAKINAALKLDTSRSTVDAYFRNKRKDLGVSGSYFDDEVNAEPIYWDSHFVNILSYRWVAGLGRRGASWDYQTWSTVTGKKVDLWAWLGSSLYTKVLPPKLLKHLQDSNKLDPNSEPGEDDLDCTDYYGKGSWTLSLEKTGMVIYEEAYGDGCEESYQISYSELLPFLSPEGTTAVKSILGRN